MQMNPKARLAQARVILGQLDDIDRRLARQLFDNERPEAEILAEADLACDMAWKKICQLATEE